MVLGAQSWVGARLGAGGLGGLPRHGDPCSGRPPPPSAGRARGYLEMGGGAAAGSPSPTLLGPPGPGWGSPTDTRAPFG